MSTFVDLSRTAEPDVFIPDVLPWIHEAGNPYFDWLFGGALAARSIVADWMRRPTSEVSIRRVLALNLADKPIGGFIALTGDELARCRRADLLALLRSGLDRARLGERLDAVRGLFHEVGPDAYYLSKIGLNPRFREQGFGGRLVDECLRRGAEAGLRIVCLEVCSENSPALSLYGRRGFEEADRRRSELSGIEYRFLVKQLR